MWSAGAAGYGLHLRRLLVAGHPGEHFAEVVTALAAACPVVLAAAPTGLNPRALDRLAATCAAPAQSSSPPDPGPGVGDGWGS